MASGPVFHSPKDYLDLARSPQATPEQLRELARSPYEFVIEAVATHRSTPADVLSALVPAEIRTDSDGSVLVALVENPNTPETVLRQVPELVLPLLSARENHRTFAAGVALTERADTPEDVLIALVNDRRATPVFREVVSRRTAHPALRAQLQVDQSRRTSPPELPNGGASPVNPEHVPSFAEWSHMAGQDMTIWNFLTARGLDLDLLAALATLFVPAFVERLDCVLLAENSDEETFDHWWEITGGSRAGVEGQLNHVHVGDILGVEAGDRRLLREVAEAVAVSWRRALREGFPDRRFTVVVEASSSTPVVTFWQE